MSITALRPTAATYFGNNSVKKNLNELGGKVEKSWWGKQLYIIPNDTSKVPWYLRWKGYGSKANLTAGWNNAMDWFKPKDTAGKILAIATLAAGIATDFGAHLLIVGIPYVASKVLFTNMNISGFATAFHDGVHKAYEKQYVDKHPEKTAKATPSNPSSSKDTDD
ncbi:MAG: hypothetical protein QE263_03535 [Vampirovibrionales bacterium]|nr:hypothetical protein [Vampirovibrionales bacterium]